MRTSIVGKIDELLKRAIPDGGIEDESLVVGVTEKLLGGELDEQDRKQMEYENLQSRVLSRLQAQHKRCNAQAIRSGDEGLRFGQPDLLLTIGEGRTIKFGKAAPDHARSHVQLVKKDAYQKMIAAERIEREWGMAIETLEANPGSTFSDLIEGRIKIANEMV